MGVIRSTSDAAVSVRQLQELAAFRDHAEAEAEFARFLLSKLSRVENLCRDGVDHYLAPAELFSGDLLGVSQSDSGDLYGMLADATGHGLGAAINLIPLTTAFYAMSSKGFNLTAIAGQLNKVVLDHSMPDRFVAVTLARLVAREQRVEVVNAGNPAAVLWGPGRTCLREFFSGSVPLGILPTDEFHPRVESAVLAEHDELVMFSDGVIEACNARNEAFGRSRVIEAVRATLSGQSSVPRIRQALDLHCDGLPPRDDVSILTLRAPERPRHLQAVPHWSPASGELQALMHSPSDPALAGSSLVEGWQVALTFTAAELRRLDVVPVVVDLIRTIGLPRRAESCFFTVLSELFANAFEHGLLQLDSRLKSGPEGFERFMALREVRLDALVDGQIQLRVQHHALAAGGGRLSLTVRDTGPGFDHQHYVREMLASADRLESRALSGRGLRLLWSLCDRLYFSGAGNQVSAEFSYL